MAALHLGSRHEFEARRYPVLLYVLAPLVALILQAWLPRMVGRFVWCDLPLLVTVYIALARRNPFQGMLSGAAMGLFEDALTHHAIGINGITKTLAGFLVASTGSRVDLDNHTVRMILNIGLSLLGSCLYLFIHRFLLGMDLEWNWWGELFKALGNGVLTLLLFPLFDRMQIHE